MKKERNTFRIVANICLLLLAIACFLPFCIVISTSFSSELGVATRGYTVLPHEFNLDSYRYVLQNSKAILGAYGLSIFVTTVGTLVGVLCMSGFAYAISRNDFMFKKQLAGLAYFTMLFSGGAVASYIWITRYLHLMNNVLVLILPVMINAWNIFILRTSFKTTPMSLIESAQIDGYGELKIFFSIVVPLQKTAIATISLLTIFAYWNEWYLSMMYMDTAKVSTIQYYLVRILNDVEFVKRNSSSVGMSTADLPSEGMQMAVCVLAVGPLMIVFPFFQKYFVSGVQVGAVKG